MAYTTPNMSLAAWDLETDPYDHTDLYNNWIAVDNHNHTPGKGAPLPPEALPELGQDNLGTCSVNTLQICEGAVTQSRLASPAVQEVNIFNSAVSSSKIANNAISVNHIQSNAVTEAKIANDSITTLKLADGAVTNIKIGNNQISTLKLANNAVSKDKIQTAAVGNNKLEDQAVTTEKLGAASVTRPKIGNNAVGPDQLGQVPCVLVIINSAKNVGDGEFYEVNWDANQYDTDDMWDFVGNRNNIRIHTRGLYLVEGGLLWDGGSDNAGRRAKLRKNNTPIAGAGPNQTLKDDSSGDAPYRVRHSMTAVARCDDGDVIDLVAQQYSGGSRQLLPDGFTTHLSVTWIAPFPS